MPFAKKEKKEKETPETPKEENENIINKTGNIKIEEK